ncbi:MAG: helix-turn-helix transcriptional regulator [Bacteroidetes bacterium]|jgi:transcriptional regulator with XRE-family HTH domain|uniref:Helix-turn-helix transcriptional regulator n=1 Tax=Candidatus Cryptobacteroides faecavium TaxID=2840762 RepID=A0A9D9IDC3_9BACT|nr:helix-turn-helix transcriptional regulator [Candidatus Cryptobacteroides faecavium]
MDNKTVKENIYRIRKEKKITQQQMAERLGMSRNSYRRIESGDTVLVNDHIVQIADLLEMSPDELLLGDSASDGRKILDEMRVGYAQEISDRNRTISSLEERIRLLEDLVRTKDEIITMLKKQEQR